MSLPDNFSAIANEYLSAAGEARVFPAEEAIQGLQELGRPLQQDPIDASEVLALLHRLGSPATVRSTGGRYYGFVIGGSLPAAMSAKLLATVWDQNAALTAMSPVASAIESITGKWLLQLLDLPPESGFGFVTGDTMANFTALAAARHAVLKAVGWDAEAKGLFGAPEIKVIVGDEVHVSVLKALSMLGMGRERIIRVPADEQGRMIADKIPATEGPAIICCQAGNVNSGAFDDVAAICRRRTGNSWVHVDAAFGLWAAAGQTRKYLARGIADADSWATDAHKWLNVPYDSGIVFVRDAPALFAAMSASPAAYIPADGSREAFQYVPEMSREARAIPVWAALKSLGVNGLASMIDRCCDLAQQFADGLKAAGFEVLNEVVLNQVLVHFGDAALTQRIIRDIQEEGVCWCGGTVWHGRPAMRISVSSWVTTEEDVQRSLTSIIRHAGKQA
ncbi:MAG: aspartate aminotransferase family protein [Bacteroidetes bacterium]|nr:aspartate aminotransferase family protein [Bacteroidota bacterium]